METAIRKWLDLLAFDHSESTVRSYAWELNALVKAVPRERPEDYSLDDLTGYIAGRRASYLANEKRRGEKLSDCAVKRSVWAFKAFFGHYLKEASPALNLPSPQPKKRRQRVLDEDQALMVLAACETRTARGARDLALLAIMIDSGIRAGEVCRLQLAKVDLQAREFYVVIKGGDEERGSYTTATANILNLWLAHRELIVQPGVGNLFVATGGTYWVREGGERVGKSSKGRALTTDGLRRIMAYVAGRAGLAHLSPHDLRRTFADLLINVYKAPINEAQELGRWKTREQALDYARHSDRKRSENFLPIGRLLGG